VHNVPFDDETRVDRIDDETRVDREEPRGRRLYAAVDGQLVNVPVEALALITLGRAPESTVSLDHRSVSRAHAQIQTQPTLTVRDLGSSNGTWVKGNRLQGDAPVAIAPGEVIRLGDVSVWIEQRATDPEEPGAALRTPAQRSGDSPVVLEDTAMKALYELVDRVARGTINVLLLGETGVGKEVVARAIHFRSERAGHPFVAINCAAVSEQLLESELFGHEQGAFTGANTAKPGLLETAEGGTVLLDEIGELSLSSQAKLLRALEEHKVFRLGSLKPREIDVRFLSATNRDLGREVEADRFRRDLFYRLNGVSLPIPPLRDRVLEIEPLARRYVRFYSSSLGRTPPALRPDALAALRSYRWPGNIRELRNVIQRAVLVCADEPIGATHLLLRPAAPGATERDTAEPPTDASPQRRRSVRATDRLQQGEAPELPEQVSVPASATLKEAMDALERNKILSSLKACGGNQTRAAKVLGISRNTLLRKLDRYGVPRPRKGAP
jgi:two-component system, NtrC family, response regulator AtoC